LVELMNGKIKVASTIGVGTQVSIQIPFREPTAAQSQAIHLGPPHLLLHHLLPLLYLQLIAVFSSWYVVFLRLSLCRCWRSSFSGFVGGRPHNSAHHVQDV
jgi:hypothetical protein